MKERGRKTENTASKSLKIVSKCRLNSEKTWKLHNIMALWMYSLLASIWEA